MPTQIDDASRTLTPPPDTFQLTPPEVIRPLSDDLARKAVPLPAQTSAAVEDQVARFMDALMSEDLQSEAFKARLDSAFALGREEISMASSLMQGRFMQRNFVGLKTSTTLRSMSQGRATYTMEFKHYTEAPKNVADAIITARGK